MFAENMAMRLIGLVTTVIVLGAVYLFIVKPILDTTNNALDSVNDSIDTAFEQSGLNDINVSQLEDGDFSSVQKQINSSGLSAVDRRRAEKLVRCVQRVQPDTSKMQVCAQRYR